MGAIVSQGDLKPGEKVLVDFGSGEGYLERTVKIVEPWTVEGPALGEYSPGWRIVFCRRKPDNTNRVVYIHRSDHRRK